MPSSEEPRFRIPARRPQKPSDPEALFRSLAGRSKNVEYLWSHQADILRQWFSHFEDTSDLAIELPTGTGKTLIGLLISEFRRLSSNERVAYLCPTRQLAHQVGKLAEEYSIAAKVLVGPQASYDNADYNAYASALAIAVTTYSAVFNVSPRINDANVLILDDAHASENFIASLWSVDIDRLEDEDAYLSILELFQDALPSWLLANLRGGHDPRERSTSDKVPSPAFNDRIEHLRVFLDHAQQGDFRYPWRMIRANLHACHMYLSWPVISIRPVIPPTLTHAPFASATQRIYMSATLGEGGELERITGVKNISRLPTPEGWERQGSGRRFILFPDLSLPRDTADHTVAAVVSEEPRTLVLTPDRTTASRVIGLLEDRCSGLNIFEARDVETSLDDFVRSEHAALVLHGRYDGLDLPGDSCHLEVIYGLPGATNAQERFLLNRLGAQDLLRDRIRTRLTQALGRCTRSAVDHAVVLITGERTVDFCIKRENRNGFHPELQAELEYGFDASSIQFPEELKAVASDFLAKVPGWEEVDSWIREYRDTASRLPDPAAATLMAISAYEVDYSYAMWQEDFETALEKARQCVDKLGGPDHAPYRAWWYYLAGCAAWASAKRANNSHLAEVARDMFKRAAAAAPAVTWFRELARIPMMQGNVEEPEDSLLLEAVENIENRLGELGVVGTRFEKEVAQILSLIEDDEATPFEQGLEQLGRLLGFDAIRPGKTGDPDGIWRISDHVIVAIEAKSNQSAGGPISLSDTRETQGHINWVRSNLSPAPNTEVFAIVVSPRSVISSDALPQCSSLYLVSCSEVRETAREVMNLIRGIRANATEEPSEGIRSLIGHRLREHDLDPCTLLQFFRRKSLSELPVV
jgi:hypothetical protein